MATAVTEAEPTTRPIRVAQRGALTPPEAAEYLGTTVGTLAAWRHRGEGPPFVRLGRKIVYRMASLDRYLEELEQEPAEQF